MSLKDKIIYSDLLGQQVQLKIDGYKRSKTMFGGLLTISSIIMLIAFFVYCSEDLVYHNNPQISEENQILSPYPRITLNKSNHQMAFFLSFSDNIAIEYPRHFEYKFIHKYGDPFSNLLNETYDLAKCQKKYFPEISQEKYEEKNLDNFLCMENFNFEVSGFWTEKYISYLDIQVRKCQNTTIEKKCAPIEEIDELMSNNTFYWNIIFLNNFINPRNYQNPKSLVWKQFYMSLSHNSFKFTEIFFRKENLISDEGFIFKSKNIIETSSYLTTSYNGADITIENILSSFYIHLSNEQITTFRFYIKIQNALANVGGLANILFKLMEVICYYFSIYKRDEILLNKVFDIKTDDVSLKSNKIEILDFIPDRITRSEISKVNTKAKSILNPENLKEDNSDALKSFDNQVIKEEINLKNLNSSNNNKINEDIFRAKVFNPINNKNRKYQNFHAYSYLSKSKYFKKNFTKFKGNTIKKVNVNLIETRNLREKFFQESNGYIKIAFCEIIRGKICRCFRTKKLFEKLKLFHSKKHLINQFLDISFIISKLDEFDKLKMVILNKEQISLFNCISKETVSLNNVINPFTQYKSSVENKKNIVENIIKFNNKISKGKISNVIDAKLVKFMKKI